MRLIDGDALIEKFNEKADMAERIIDARTAERFATFCALADAVEEMPTADAEVVVRCKDCVYWGNEETKVATEYQLFCVCDDLKRRRKAENCMTNEDFFCASGERRTNEQ